MERTKRAHIIVGGCGEFPSDLPYIGLISEIFRITHADISFVDLGSIVNVDDVTIQETIQIYGFSLIIDSVTHYPDTDTCFIQNQTPQSYLILRNVLGDPRTEKENILTSIAACNILAGLLFVDSYTPKILFDDPPEIDLLRKNFRRVRVNPTIKQTILNIELNQRMSIRNIYPYPNKRLGHFRKFIYNLRCKCLFDVFHRKEFYSIQI